MWRYGKILQTRAEPSLLELCRVLLNLMERILSDISLRNEQKAGLYVSSLSPKYRQKATEAILECLRLGYPLNDMEITSKALELQRKRQRTNT